MTVQDTREEDRGWVRREPQLEGGRLSSRYLHRTFSGNTCCCFACMVVYAHSWNQPWLFFCWRVNRDAHRGSSRLWWDKSIRCDSQESHSSFHCMIEGTCELRQEQRSFVWDGGYYWTQHHLYILQHLRIFNDLSDKWVLIWICFVVVCFCWGFYMSAAEWGTFIFSILTCGFSVST